MSKLMLNCPTCQLPMVMIDTGDSCKELECKHCRVTKRFTSWEEQGEYEKEYAKTMEQNIPISKQLNDFNERLIKLEAALLALTQSFSNPASFDIVTNRQKHGKWWQP